jgi:hypothetical protein
MKDRSGAWMTEGDDPDQKRTMMQYFMAVFPNNSMRRIIQLTNKKLRDKDIDEIDVGDLLKFFGICIVITKFEFGSRAELWSRTPSCPYIPAVCLGETTGMGRNRFDEIWHALTFSNQLEERPEWMSQHEYRWSRVDDFVNDFNEHRRANFRPSEVVRLCKFIQDSNLLHHRFV